MEKSTGERKWIGKILSVNENDTFLKTFLRSKCTATVSYSFIYTYGILRNQMMKPFIRLKYAPKSCHKKIFNDAQNLLFTLMN